MDIKENNEIWLNIRNIKIKALSKKLNNKWKSLFKVLKKVKKINFELDLLKIIR